MSDSSSTSTGTGAGTSDTGRGRLAHRLLPMTGRDPDETHRVATPLELLFDLTFVVAVGTAAHQFAEALAEGHTAPAVLAFLLAMFAISIAWISFSWFASAFGTDDWLYRALTMVQMTGVVVFALGIPALFHSAVEGDHLNLRLMVVGYIVMRLAMVLQWWRVHRESPQFRKVSRSEILWILVAQVCWTVVAFTHLPSVAVILAVVAIGTLELLLPVFAQGRAGGTPWHPHHTAERYSLFTIIVLGESVVGTAASSGDLLGGADGTHWTGNAVAVIVAGIGLTFGMWWVYFATPFGDILTHRRSRGYLFGYGHIPVFIAIAAVGAGLHLAGLYMEHHAHLGRVAVVLALALPTGLYLFMVYLLHTLLLSAADRFHLLLVSLTLLVLAAAALLAVAGVSVAVCLLVIMLAPFVTVLGYETVGRRHQQQMLHRLRARHPS